MSSSRRRSQVLFLAASILSILFPLTSCGGRSPTVQATNIVASTTTQPSPSSTPESCPTTPAQAYAQGYIVFDPRTWEQENWTATAGRDTYYNIPFIALNGPDGILYAPAELYIQDVNDIASTTYGTRNDNIPVYAITAYTKNGRRIIFLLPPNVKLNSAIDNTWINAGTPLTLSSIPSNDKLKSDILPQQGQVIIFEADGDPTKGFYFGQQLNCHSG